MWADHKNLISMSPVAYCRVPSSRKRSVRESGCVRQHVSEAGGGVVAPPAAHVLSRRTVGEHREVHSGSPSPSKRRRGGEAHVTCLRNYNCLNLGMHDVTRRSHTLRPRRERAGTMFAAEFTSRQSADVGPVIVEGRTVLPGSGGRRMFVRRGRQHSERRLKSNVTMHHI